MTTSAAPCARCGGFMEYNSRDKDYTCINCGNAWSPTPLSAPMEKHESLVKFWEKTRRSSNALDSYRRMMTQQARRRQERAVALTAAGMDFDSLRVSMNVSKRTLHRYLQAVP